MSYVRKIHDHNYRDNLLQLLDELEEYFEARQDCDVIGEVHVPNKEMNLLNDVYLIKEYLEKKPAVTG